MNEKEFAAANFAMWNDALKTLDPKKVALLYTETATFLQKIVLKAKK